MTNIIGSSDVSLCLADDASAAQRILSAREDFTTKTPTAQARLYAEFRSEIRDLEVDLVRQWDRLCLEYQQRIGRTADETKHLVLRFERSMGEWRAEQLAAMQEVLAELRSGRTEFREGRVVIMREVVASRGSPRSGGESLFRGFLAGRMG